MRDRGASVPALPEVLRDSKLASVHIVSLKKTATITFLLSIFVLLNAFADVLRRIWFTKFPNAAVTASLGEDLFAAALGIGVCTLLYASYAVLDSSLQRRMVRWEQLKE
jgi:hypothetical protein